jgi:hypothetical protein
MAAKPESKDSAIQHSLAELDRRQQAARDKERIAALSQSSAQHGDLPCDGGSQSDGLQLQSPLGLPSPCATAPGQPDAFAATSLAMPTPDSGRSLPLSSSSAFPLWKMPGAYPPVPQPTHPLPEVLQHMLRALMTLLRLCGVPREIFCAHILSYKHPDANM